MGEGRGIGGESFATNEGFGGGKFGAYPGGGYVRDVDNPIDCRQRPPGDENGANEDGICERPNNADGVPVARADMLAAVDQLKTNLWLDEATRMMSIKVTFFNGNLDFFLVVQFLFEFSQGGIVYPSASYSVVKQKMYSTETSYVSGERERG